MSSPDRWHRPGRRTPLALAWTLATAACAPSACGPAGEQIDIVEVEVPSEFARQAATLERLYVTAHQYPDSTPLWEDWACEINRLSRVWVESADVNGWMQAMHRRVDQTQISPAQHAAARDAMARRQFLTTSEAGCAEAARAGRLGDTVWLPATVFSDLAARRHRVASRNGVQ